MRQSFRRAGTLAVAALLALAGVVALAGTASAARQPNSMRETARVQNCAFPSGCTRDVVDILAGTGVATYCVSDIFNVIYSGPATGRGGFVNRSSLTNPTGQGQACDAAGEFVQVRVAANLSSCSGTCVNFGGVIRSDVGGAFCQLGSGPRWFLVYMDRTGRAGYLPETVLERAPGVPDCNTGFRS